MLLTRSDGGRPHEKAILDKSDPLSVLQHQTAIEDASKMRKPALVYQSGTQSCGNSEVIGMQRQGQV
jgi:hypothetical protein